MEKGKCHKEKKKKKKKKQVPNTNTNMVTQERTLAFLSPNKDQQLDSYP